MVGGAINEKLVMAAALGSVLELVLFAVRLLHFGTFADFAMFRQFLYFLPGQKHECDLPLGYGMRRPQRDWEVGDIE